MQHAWRRVAALSAALLLPFAAMAGEGGQPIPWQIAMNGSASEIMDFIYTLHTWLFWLITVISLFVLGLLAWCVIKFNEKANPVPSRTTHHAGLEVAWTVIPVVILVAISIPSFRLLKLQDDIPQTDITIKVTGKQWYWTVEYAKDSGGFSFDAIMLDEKQRAAEKAKGKTDADVPRLLAVDNEIVLPIGKSVRVQITAADVIHAFTIPAFGIKRDAVPGRLNETWFRATKEGVYYGQCSELCGTNHAFMPAAVRIVSVAKYAEWLEDAKKKYASTTGDGAVRLAGGEASVKQ